jgi:WD40 repeat protein
MNEREQLVEELVCRCLEARARAEPGALERALADQPPDVRAQVHDMLATLDRVGLTAPAAPRPGENGAIAFGPYVLLERLGAGTMGVVHRVRDPAGNERALKLLQPALLPLRPARQRFAREVHALRTLDHPGICRVLDAGEVDGVPFLVMPLLAGESLQARFARAPSRTRAQREELLALVEQIAHALHHAHEHGFVHRDVKPANVLITADGRPVLLDFGLARLDRGDDGSVSQPHDVIGAPAYMAPEQIVDGGGVDRRADVYALGAVLYEGLTESCPYEGATRESLYRRILDGDAVPPSRRQPGIERALDAVCLTAMARDRARRYQTAAAFAADVARVRAGERPIAQLPGSLERSRRWIARNPLPASLLLVLVLAVVVAVRQTLSQQRASARDRARVLAAEALDTLAGDPRRAEHLALAAHALAPDLLEPATAVEAARAAAREPIVLAGHEQPLAHLEFDSAGERLVSAAGDGTARVWNVRAGTSNVLPHGGDGPALASFQPAGDLVATGGATDGRVCAWRAATGALLWHRNAHGAGRAVRVLRWSPDGRWLLSGGAGGARLWSLHGDAVDVASTPAAVTAGAWLAGDTFVITTGDDGAPAGSERHRVAAFRVTAAGVALVADAATPGGTAQLSPRPGTDSTLLAIGETGNAWLWSVGDGVLRPLPHVHLRGVHTGAWTADGDNAMTLAIGGRLAYFDAEGTHRQSVYTLPWSTALVPHPRQRYAAVSGGNGVVQLRSYDGTNGLLLGRRRLRPAPVSFSPDGAWLATVDWQHAIALWPTWRRDYPLFFAGDHVLGAVWSADGQRIVTGSMRNPPGTASVGIVRSWDAASGALLESADLPAPVLALLQSRTDGSVVAVTGSWDLGDARTVADAAGRLHRGAAGESSEQLPSVLEGALLDGGKVALVQESGRLVVRDLAAAGADVVIDVAAPEPPGGAASYLLAVAARPDGATLWCGGTSGQLYRHDRDAVGGYRAAPPLVLGQNIRALEAVDDGGLLVGLANGGLQRHLPGGERVTFAGHRDDVAAVGWVRTGGELLIASGDAAGSVRLWQADGTPLRAIRAHAAAVWSVRFSACGTRLLTASHDGTARIWPVTLPLPR